MDPTYPPGHTRSMMGGTQYLIAEHRGSIPAGLRVTYNRAFVTEP